VIYMPNFKMASKMATTRVNVTTIHRVNWLHCSETRTISARLVLNTRGPGSQIEFISSVHVFVCLFVGQSNEPDGFSASLPPWIHLVFGKKAVFEQS